MITPAYGMTSTERVLPSLALDFTTGVLDARVTVARALNTATRTNSAGKIETVNANLPRFDYDPVTLEPKGLLIEETRTNFLLRSEQINNAPWSPSASAITPDTTISPSGLLNADTINEQAATAAHTVTQAYAGFTSGVTYSVSVYVKAGTATALQILGSLGVFGANVWANFDVANGVVGSAGTSASSFITSVGDGWYRCTMTGAATATSSGAIGLNLIDNNPSATRAPSYTGTNRELYLWGAQLEAGAFATSYIPTVASTVTRNADVVTMTGTNFSDWYNASEGTFAANANVGSLAGAFNFFFMANNGTASNVIGIRKGPATSANLAAIVTDATISQASILCTGALPAGQNFRATLAYRANDFAAAGAGATPGTDNVGTIPTLDRLDIGSQVGSLFLNGTIANLQYWPQRLINAEVQAFSK